MLKSSADRYGAIPITIHWLRFQAGNAIDPAVKIAFLRIHIPVAIIALLLTLFRIVWWWFFDRKPQPVGGSPLWQERLARAVHLALYIVILGMIASGIGIIALSSAGPIIFSGAGGELPNLHRYPPRVSHGLGANLLVVLLVAHVGVALYHHFIRGDGLHRWMWYGG